MPYSQHRQRIGDAPVLVLSGALNEVGVDNCDSNMPDSNDPGAERETHAIESRGAADQCATEGVEQGRARVIVFVCTGNTCRSPIAEALLKKRLADHLGCSVEDLAARGFVVLSAGLAAMIGNSAAPEAVESVWGYGADLSAHASRPVTADLLAQADYVLAMTSGHLRILTALFPEAASVARLLAPDGEDIADPVGCELDVYETCARRIWTCLDSLVAELVTGTR